MDFDEVDPATLGGILNTMMAAGASEEVLGRFALMYRNKRLAALPAPVVEMGPVLESFATEVAKKVMAAVGTQQVAAPGPAAVSKAQPAHKIIRLKVGGKATSVSMPVDLFHKAAVALGSEAAATAAAKQLASQAPANTPRSGYMQAQLLKAIAAATAMPAASPSAMH